MIVLFLKEFIFQEHIVQILHVHPQEHLFYIIFALALADDGDYPNAEKNLDEAENQYQIAIRNHLIHI